MDSTEEKPNDIVTGSDPEGALAADVRRPQPHQALLLRAPRRCLPTAVRPYRGHLSPRFGS
eukprot:2272534-Prymnesium_polylepis.1